jgi:ABC-2 type transport system permease protein
VIVLRRFLADRRRSLAGWSVAAVLLVLMTVAFYPTIRDQPSIEDVVRDLPDALKATFGMDDAVPLSSPAGYLHGRMFSLTMPLALVVFAIGAGARAIGGSEEDGDLELLLAQPVTRASVLLGRFAAVMGLTTAVGAVFTVALLALGPLFGALEGLRIGWLLAACAGAIALALLHAAVAFAAGSVRGTRSAGVAAGAVVAAAGYLLQGLLAAAKASEAAKFASPWHWYLRRNMLVGGPDALAFVLPVSLVAVLLVVALVAFDRRDLR